MNVRSVAVTEQPGRVLVETARRMNLAELIKRGDWLTGRFTTRYPQIPKQQAISWLRLAMDDSRNFLFIMNDGGVTLCEQLREDLNTVPVVFERFVLAWKQETIPQAAQLYRDISGWAKSMRAREIHVERFTDIPRPMIRKYLGHPLFEKTLVFADLGKEQNK